MFSTMRAVAPGSPANSTQGKSGPGRLRSKFTLEEDEQLRAILSQVPDGSWRDIARLFPGKSVRQLRERYRNYLDPQLNHGSWTPAEDALLFDKFVTHGPQWSILKQFFVNRSDVNIKNRWSVLSSKMQYAAFSPIGFPAPPRQQMVYTINYTEAPAPTPAPDPAGENAKVVEELFRPDSETRRSSFDSLDPFSGSPFDEAFGGSSWTDF
jgi:hypothetical protein